MQSWLIQRANHLSSHGQTSRMYSSAFFILLAIFKMLRSWLIWMRFFFFIPFRCNVSGLVIVAEQVYVYNETDIKTPSGFLDDMLRASGLLYYTIPAITSIQPTTKPGNSTDTGAAWILGFVIPCGIVLILLPCWILLCVSILCYFNQLGI